MRDAGLMQRDIGGSSCSIIQSIISAFTWRYGVKPQKILGILVSARI
jgi:hypothetical protein